MVKNRVFQEVQRKYLPSGAKPIDSTWACKKKSNGTHRARVNSRRFKQILGQHYDSSSIHAPVTNETSIRVILVLMLIANWTANVVDVKGIFCMVSSLMAKRFLWKCHKDLRSTTQAMWY